MKSAKFNHSEMFYSTLIFCACLFMASCSPPLSIKKPINVSKANQSVTTQFTVEKSGTYKFAFLFVRAKTLAAMESQIAIWGDIDNAGVPIKLKLRVLRDDIPIFNEYIQTTGTNGGYTFLHENQRLNTAMRTIRILELPLGNYTAELTTLDNVEPFEDTLSYIEVGYHNPKH